MDAITARAIALLLALGLFFGSAGAGRARIEPPPQEPRNPPATTSLSASVSTLSGSARPSQTPPPEPGLRILRSDESGIMLELLTPDFQIEPLVTEEIACDRLGAAGYATSDRTGWPELPVRGAMLGIPPQADVTLTVLEVDAGTLPGAYDLCPVPGPIVEMTPDGEVQHRGTTRARDARAYAADAFWPATPAEIVSTGFIRSQRVVQVRFHPFQYNPVSGQLRHLRRILVRLDFGSRPLLAAAAAAPVDEGPFEAILSHALLNYDAARAWRSSDLSNDTLTTEVVTTNTYRISINADGLYQVTPADLQAAGADLSGVDPRTFRLSNRGQEVAIHVEGEADGSFDPGDVLLFYGQGLDTRYTDTNVYWLTWGGADGPRMPEVDGTPTGTATVPTHFLTTRRAERNRAYQSAYPSGPDEDRWYWDIVFASGTPATKTFTTTLEHLAAVPLSGTLRGLFRGYDGIPEHHTRVYLNGHLVDDVTWPPKTEHAFEVAVPQPILIEGTNAISVVSGIGNTQDIVFVNWFEIDYYATYAASGDALFFDGDAAGTWEYRVSGFTTETLELLDVTLPLSPTRILSTTVQPGSGVYTLTFQQTISAEHRYLALSPAQRRTPLRLERDAPSDLRAATNGADYVIVTHGDFYTAMLPLAAHRAAQGLRVAVVDVQDIYDEFNDGIFDPQAIRDFLAYAYAHWTPPAPAYVLLVGDGNYDFRNYREYGEPNYVPPYLANVDYWIGETAADNRYVCVSGGDVLPDMHLGRLPVKTAGEASALVTKILEYEQNPPPGDWNEQLLFVADNADSAGDFADLSDDIVNDYVAAPYTPERVYYGITHTDAAAARAAILDALNAGRLLVNYVGHGAIQVWAQEHLLEVNSIAALANAGRLPLIVPMTCSEGYFITPSPAGSNFSCLGEAIVRAQGKGAIASWSPTGMSLAAGHDYLNRGLFEALFLDDVVRLGPATTQARLYLYRNTGSYRDLLDTYVLFGDPALALNVPPVELGIAKSVEPPGALYPGDAITYTLTYSNAGPATAHHVVVTDVLPAILLNPTVRSAGAAVTLRPGTRFVWDVADLAAGAGGVITITGIVSPTFTGIFSNTAAIAATGVETNTANNVTAPILTGVSVPDLAITKHGPEMAPAGSVVTYTLAYSNAGSALATQVVISDVLPSTLLDPTILSASVVITPRTGTRFVWDVGDLAAGEGGSITITVVLSPTCGGPLSNTAVIMAATGEIQQANNVATQVTWVQHRLYLPIVLRTLHPSQSALPPMKKPAALQTR